jgi:hypothetical protein
MNKYDLPTLNANMSQDDILDLFAHNEQFAMLWLRLMVTNSRGQNMPIEQHRKIVGALRDYLSMLSNMLAGTEMLLDQVEEMQT